MLMGINPLHVNAQITTQWLDTTAAYQSRELGYFFTNRKPKKSEDGSTDFRNRWTRQTKKLYFCRYDYDTKEIYLKYLAEKTLPKRLYPTGPVDNNFFYQVYKDLRIEQGIRNFVFIVPGMGKTFDNQLNNYMFRVQQAYADTLGASAFITFAWSDQAVTPFYYKAQRSADRAANDFAIFQHMLESFRADSVFFRNNPDDITIKLICMSEGNEMFKRYLIQREWQGIELVPIYDKIVFVGSDASADSFEKGKGFDNLTAMADSVLVLVNSIDGPLTLATYMNLQNRLGKAGPTNYMDLPGNILVKDITRLIELRDLPALGHDYFLRNQSLRRFLLHGNLSESPR